MANCPSEFVLSPVGTGACVIPCPAGKNYEVRVGTAGLLSCTYIGDPKISVSLLPVPAVQRPGPPFSYKDLPNASVYKTEIDRFNAAFALADANIDKSVKIKTAYDRLQNAENARDVSPDAYNQARLSYYTLTKGDTWLQEEKQRIAQVEAQPVVDDIVSKNQDLQNRMQQQKSTLDIVNGVRENVLSVEDDLQYSVSAFERQIRNIRNQMNMDKKKQVETVKQTSSWFNSMLNWLIIIATIIAIVVIVRYFMRPKAAFSSPGSSLLPK
jgi:hypothetical protein